MFSFSFLFFLSSIHLPGYKKLGVMYFCSHRSKTYWWIIILNMVNVSEIDGGLSAWFHQGFFLPFFLGSEWCHRDWISMSCSSQTHTSVRAVVKNYIISTIFSFILFSVLLFTCPSTVSRPSFRLQIPLPSRTVEWRTWWLMPEKLRVTCMNRLTAE